MNGFDLNRQKQNGGWFERMFNHRLNDDEIGTRNEQTETKWRTVMGRTRTTTTWTGRKCCAHRRPTSKNWVRSWKRRPRWPIWLSATSVDCKPRATASALLCFKSATFVTRLLTRLTTRWIASVFWPSTSLTAWNRRQRLRIASRNLDRSWSSPTPGKRLSIIDCNYLIMN